MEHESSGKSRGRIRPKECRCTTTCPPRAQRFNDKMSGEHLAQVPMWIGPHGEIQTHTIGCPVRSGAMQAAIFSAWRSLQSAC